DRPPEALSQNELGMRRFETGVERRALRPLHAVVRPQDLLAIGGLDNLEGLFAGMRTGKGGVAARMPVLGQDHMGKFARQPVDRRNDLVAVLDGEGPARAEIVLEIDDKKDVLVARLHGFSRNRGIISRAMIST